MRGHADRLRALLGQSGIIDHQDGVRPADKLVGLGEEFSFQRRLVPRTHRHEVMQLVIVGRSHAGGHWLQALALTGADQPGHIEWAHAPAGRVTKRVEEGFEPGLKFVLPSNRGAHDSPPTRISQREKSSELARFLIPAKVVLAVWMRDLLGMSDDLEGWRQSV